MVLTLLGWIIGNPNITVSEEEELINILHASYPVGIFNFCYTLGCHSHCCLDFVRISLTFIQCTQNDQELVGIGIKQKPLHDCNNCIIWLCVGDRVSGKGRENAYVHVSIIESVGLG